jgi:hypothetical protein
MVINGNEEDGIVHSFILKSSELPWPSVGGGARYIHSARLFFKRLHPLLLIDAEAWPHLLQDQKMKLLFGSDIDCYDSKLGEPTACAGWAPDPRLAKAVVPASSAMNS